MLLEVELVEANVNIGVLVLHFLQDFILDILLALAAVLPQLLLWAQVLNWLLIQWIIYHQFICHIARIKLNLVCSAIEYLTNDCLLLFTLGDKTIKFLHLFGNLVLIALKLGVYVSVNLFQTLVEHPFPLFHLVPGFLFEQVSMVIELIESLV